MEKYGVGTIHTTNEGYKIEIIEKFKNDQRRVKFENGYELSCDRKIISKGKIKNPYHLSVCGVGYFGVGEYKASINEKHTSMYTVWHDMLKRCYDEKIQKRHPTYKGITVCKEWHNYQNFAEWYNENLPKDIYGVKFELDKDLLQRGIKNKIYSPNTCVFLPKNVNLALRDKTQDSLSNLVGVSWYKSNKKWLARIRVFEENTRIHLGYFTTPELASEAYQTARKIEVEKVKNYLRSLNYLSEDIIQLIK